MIRINPYETARLARRFGLGVQDFSRLYTMRDGLILRMTESGRCIFRGFDGCSVYADRPLVCRLYPLRYNYLEDGRETFDVLEDQEECSGVVGEEGRLGEYLQGQDAVELIDIMRDYVMLTDRLLDILKERMANEPIGTDELQSAFSIPEFSGSSPLSGWLDMDAVVYRWAQTHGSKHTGDLQDRIRIHFDAVESYFREELWKEKLEEHNKIEMLAKTLVSLGYTVGVDVEKLYTEAFPKD